MGAVEIIVNPRSGIPPRRIAVSERELQRLHPVGLCIVCNFPQTRQGRSRSVAPLLFEPANAGLAGGVSWAALLLLQRRLRGCQPCRQQTEG